MPNEIRLVSVILPTYNEAGNIVALVEAIHSAITLPHDTELHLKHHESHVPSPSSPPSRGGEGIAEKYRDLATQKSAGVSNDLNANLYEIIVVDDNSPDGTSRLVQEVIDSGRIPGLRLETRTHDRGLTKSLWRGIELARGDTIVWLDCDFSMPPEKIPDLLVKVAEGTDIAVGSRFVPGGSYKRGVNHQTSEESIVAIFLSRIINMMLRFLLSPRFRDYTSGFIAIRREVFTQIRLTGDYGEYFMDLMFRSILLGHSFVEVPYVNLLRRAGESKTAPNLRTLFKRGVKYLWMILRLWGIRLKHLAGGSITDRDALPS